MKNPFQPKPKGERTGKNPRLLSGIFPLTQTLRPLFQVKAPVLKVADKLEIRGLKPADTDRLFGVIELNREFLEGWLSWIDLIRTPENCRDFVHSVNYEDIFANGWVYSMWYEGDLAGLIDFNEGDRDLNQISIGYWLAEIYQGHGIVSRCVEAALDYVFFEQDIARVLLKCATDNDKSQAVALRKGFSWEGIEHDAGTVNGKAVDLNIYSMLWRDWKERKDQIKDQNS